jgi:ABC-type multidrug transport system fused ATPase/permease subunit
MKLSALLRSPAGLHVQAALRASRGHLIKALGASLMRAGCWFLLILLVQRLLTVALLDAAPHRNATLTAVGAAALGLYLLAALGTWLGASGQHRAARAVEQRLMGASMVQLQRLSLPFVASRSPGDLVDALRSDIIATRGVVLAGVQILLDGVLALVLALALLHTSPALTLVCLVLLPAAMFPTVLVGRRLLHAGQRARDSRVRLFDALMQLIQGMPTVEGMGAGDRAAASSHAAGIRWLDREHVVLRDRALAQTLFEALGGLSLVLAIAAGSVLVHRGDLSVPALVAFLLALRAIQRPLDLINQRWAAIEANLPSITRIDQLLREEPALRSAPDAQALEGPPRRIQLEGLRVRRGDHLALAGLDLVIEQGELLGVVGPSGAGKSTLLAALARFLDPSEGSVRFDGVDLRALALPSVRAQLACVPQQPFLVAGSVAENLSLGRPDADRQELLRALEAVALRDEIEALPQGLDTPLGIEGRGLSHGQAQRIALARAFVKAPSVVLLDEPTSAVDPEGEAWIHRALEALAPGRTVVVATHRLAVARQLPRLVVLVDGAVEAVGSHEELLEGSPTYARMWAAQVGEEPSA